MIIEANKNFSELPLEVAIHQMHFLCFPSAWLDHISQLFLQLNIGIHITRFPTVGIPFVSDRTHMISQIPLNHALFLLCAGWD